MFASFVTLTLSRDPSLVSYLTRFLTTEVAAWVRQQHVHDICDDCHRYVLDTQKKCCFEQPFLRYFTCFTYLLLYRRSKHTQSERIPH